MSKPAFLEHGFRTDDLTRCLVHRFVEQDGSARVVAFWPKTWLANEPVQMPTISGRVVDVTVYDVTEWDETVLATIPAPAVEGESQ